MIKVIQTDSQLLFVDKDENNGILLKEKDKIFQKMSNKPRAGESSSGFGLSIVKTLVEQLTGTIDFESAQRKGTSFRVVLSNLVKFHPA